MSEHIYSAPCMDCDAFIDLPVDIQTYHAGTDDVYDSVEVDMRAWHAHAATHREARGGACTEGVLGTAMSRAV